MDNKLITVTSPLLPDLTEFNGAFLFKFDELNDVKYMLKRKS